MYSSFSISTMPTARVWLGDVRPVSRGGPIGTAARGASRYRKRAA